MLREKFGWETRRIAPVFVFFFNGFDWFLDERGIISAVWDAHCSPGFMSVRLVRHSVLNISALLFIVSQLQRNDWDTAEGYTHAAQTMMLMVLKQACGRSWGDHGLFLRYHIEAASIRGINSFRHYKMDTTTIGRLVLYCTRNSLLMSKSFYF